MDLEPISTTTTKDTQEGHDEPIKAKPQADSHQFNFPYPPYDIQLDLMKVAYDSYDNSKFALLESPTGTGKSLSLICSSITWLKDHQLKVKQHHESRKEELLKTIEDLKIEEETTGDWLKVQTRCQELNKELTATDRELERLIKFEQRHEARWQAKLQGTILEENSNHLNRNSADKKIEKDDNDTNVTKNLIGSQGSSQSDVADAEDIEKIVAQQDEDHIRPKIYYSSRTHSQMSQFINEIKKTRFADIVQGPPVKLASLASRANLCVNPEVTKLREPSAINERCMEMQKESTPEKRCPYIKGNLVNILKEDILASVYDIEDLVSRGRVTGACPYYASRMAIPEAELVVLPYNNLLHCQTRQASSLDLNDSVVIVDEAHNILETICSIHSAPITGLQLLGCHTILSRYYQKYRSRMSPRNAAVVKTIVLCITALIRYLNEPKKHLKEYDCPTLVEANDSENLDSSCVTNITKQQDQLKSSKLTAKHEELIVDISKFLGASDMDRYNVFKILDYFNRSQLARKLLGFFRQDISIDLKLELHGISTECEKTPASQKKSKSPKRKKQKLSSNEPVEMNKPSPGKPVTQPAQPWELTSLEFLKKTNPQLNERNPEIQTYPIYTLIEFLRSLTNFTKDGKVLTDYCEHDILKSSLKFILLNPSSQFKQMTEEARSIVLAGGTMQPFDEFVDLLFGPLGIDRQRMSVFSCGHVIDKNHLYAATLANGPTGKPLELSYKTKSSLETLDEIGRTIMNIATVAPAGMVCFLPSYDYEQICYNRWNQIGLISKIETRSKKVFREPRQANHLRPVWDEYCKAIENGHDKNRGALLFCVVGGKMSEGINFNDDLGRCVVMIGLPFANIKSGELQQKMSHYDQICKKVVDQGKSLSGGQQYYENLCIKGVNQSIGRAIRHKNDFAAILLLDRRYSSRNSIKTGLPGWIRQSLSENDRFGPMYSQLKCFFEGIKSIGST